MEWYWWAFFLGFVAVLLGLDLGFFRGSAHTVGLREALLGTALRVGLALLFCLGIYLGWIGGYEGAEARHTAGIEFLTGYLVEIALSADNVFVFVLVFRYFQVDSAFQKRVLFWGILGAVAMRAALIFAGVALLNRFHWIVYIFAAILIYGGIKMMRDDKDEIDPEQNPVFRFFRKMLPIADGFREERFFVRENRRLLATPLFLVLIMIETTDLVFAVDSIPAVLAVTRDSFIVFTSNIFAILGLRALYFALAGILHLFRFLHYGLSGILIFIGAKMLLSGTSLAISTPQSLAVVGILLVASITASLVFPEKRGR